MRANQHILLYGTTTDGFFLGPGISKARTFLLPPTAYWAPIWRP